MAAFAGSKRMKYEMEEIDNSETKVNHGFILKINKDKDESLFN